MTRSTLAAIALSMSLAACKVAVNAKLVPSDAGNADAAMVVDAGTDAGIADSGLNTTRVPANHRAVATPCSPNRPSTVPDGGFPDAGTCSFDTDCSDDAGTGDSSGRCVYDTLDKVPICTYDRCLQDSDCDDAGVCQCDDTIVYGTNICLPGNCTIDANCGDGGYCSPTVGGCFPHIGFVAYYCHTPQDECESDSDCKFSGLYCVFDSTTTMHWLCAQSDCLG